MDFIHHLPQGTLLLREDCTILQANKLASDLLKYEITELIGKKLSSLLPQGGKDVFISFFQELPLEQVLRWTANILCGDEFNRKITLHFSRLPGNIVIAQMQEEWHSPKEKEKRQDEKIRLLEAEYLQTRPGVILINEKGEIIYFNKEFTKMWDGTPSDSDCLDHNRLLLPLLDKLEAPGEFLTKIKELSSQSDQTTSDEMELRDGRFFQRNSCPLFNEGHYLGRLWNFIEITRFKKNNKIIERKQKFLEGVLENIKDGIVAFDQDCKLTFFNQVGRELHGLQESTFTSKKWTEKFSLFQDDGITRIPTEKLPLFRIIQGEEICNEEMMIKTPDSEEHYLRVSGKAIFDNQKDKMGAVISLHDITDLKKAQNKLQYMAYHDSLTGLPNRRLFHVLLGQSINQAKRNKEKVAVCFFDLDNFKLVNDILGHEIGDNMLVKISQIVKSCLRATDMVCRWGGDEFVIALSQIHYSEDAAQIAGKVCKSIEKEIAEIYPDFSVTTSMGIALYPDHASHPDRLIRAADIAMYLAKQKGKNRYCFIASEFIPEDIN